MTDTTQDVDGWAGLVTPPLSGTRLECGTQLPLEISEDTIREEGCTYSMPGDEVDHLEGATPSVEPGVTIEVGEGGRLDVEDGTLVARGTEDEPIEFVSTEDEGGTWGGLQITTEADNRIVHGAVSDGGGTCNNANIGLSAGRRGSDAPGRATGRNCELSDSAGWGIFVNEGELTSWDNTFRNNDSGAILRPDKSHTAIHTTRFTQNL